MRDTLLEVILRILAVATTFMNNSPSMIVMSAPVSIISERRHPVLQFNVYMLGLTAFVAYSHNVHHTIRVRIQKRAMGPHNALHYHSNNHYYTIPCTCCNLSCLILIGVFRLTRVTLTFLFPVTKSPLWTLAITSLTILSQMTYLVTHNIATSAGNVASWKSTSLWLTVVDILSARSLADPAI